ncbi:MAG: tetratricopeptide repeat protein [Nitrospina sp.]|nr:tetratricopeptide repeat protein [Nitrospina sp.]
MSLAFILIILIVAGIGMTVLFKKPGTSSPDLDEAMGSSPSSESKTASGKGKSKSAPGTKLSGMAKKIDEVRKQKSQTQVLNYVLHQVDCQPADFFGRKGQIANFVNKCKEGKNLTGFFGPRGIGKTATAQRVIERIIPLYPEAQLYFNFDNAGNPEEAVTEAMEHVVNSLSPSTRTPNSPGELALQYRKLLHGKKILLFFDNIKTKEEATQLLPPVKTVGLILTSEKKLTVEGVYWEELEPLPEEDMKELLDYWASRAGFWSAEIARYAASNTMAAVLSGRFLYEYASFDPEKFATKLRDLYKELEKNAPNRHQAGLEAVFTLTFTALPEPLKILLAKLMQFPGSFLSEAEEFICEDKENVKMETLARLGFVEYNELNTRYQVPPTLALWLKNRVRGANLGQFETRRATFYMTRLQALSDLLKTKRDQAFIYFDLDWKNFQTGQAWAQHNCLKDNEIAKICQGYAELAYSLLQYRKSAAKRSAWLEGGLLAAKNLQDEEGELNCLVYLSQEYNTIREWSKAIDGFEKALHLAKKLNRPKVQLEILHGLGRAYLGQESWNKALEQFQAEAAEAEKGGQSTVLLRASEEIAHTFLLAKDPNQALGWLEKALENSRRLKDGDAEIRILAAIGKAQLQTGNAEEAIDTLQAALKSKSQSGDARAQASLHHNLGEAFLAVEEPAKAATNFKQATQWYKKNGDALGQALTSGQQGVCLLMAGDREQGLKLANTARSIFRKLNAPTEELNVLEQLAQVLVNAKDWEESSKTCQAMRQLARKSAKKPFEARALRWLGQISETKVKHQEALAYYREAFKLFNTISPGDAKKLREKIKKLENATDHI